MKKRKTKLAIIAIVILVLCIFLFQNKKSQNNKFQDEIIFFKLFSFGKNTAQNSLETKEQANQQYKQYSFNVYYKNIDFKDIYLSDTIQEETLIHEKIAPRNKRRI